MPAPTQDAAWATLDPEPRPTARARRAVGAGSSGPCDFPTEWTIAPPGASEGDDWDSGPEAQPAPAVPETTGHIT